MLAPTRDFLDQIMPVVSPARVDWNSSVFTSAPITTWASAVLAVRTSREAEAIRELDAEVTRLGGTQSPALWNQYFKSYDKVVGYCDGYVALLEKANAILPGRGRILDIGAGTGNFSARLLSGAGRRQVTAVDRSATGLAVTKKKLSLFDAQANKFRVQSGDVRYVIDGMQSCVDGAVLNNVLYTLHPVERLPFLKSVFRVLNPGASLYLCDPRLQLQGESDRLEGFLEKIASDAAKNRSPMNAFDIALVCHINRQVLCAENPFLGTKALSELALQAGFSLVERQSVYYGTCTFLHLRRPVRQRRAA